MTPRHLTSSDLDALGLLPAHLSAPTLSSRQSTGLRYAIAAASLLSRNNSSCLMPLYSLTTDPLITEAPHECMACPPPLPIGNRHCANSENSAALRRMSFCRRSPAAAAGFSETQVPDTTVT